MNVVTKVLAWAYWLCSVIAGIVYCVLTCSFLYDNFKCHESSGCEYELRNLNYAINGGSILLMFLIWYHIIVTTTYLYTRNRYAEAMSIATSYTMSVCTIMYTIILRGTLHYIHAWSSDQNDLKLKAIRILGYILTGIYGFWVTVVIVTRNPMERSVDASVNTDEICV